MIFLGIFVFLVFLLAYYRKRSTRKQSDVETQFWNRENLANQTRRQDISGLPYLNIPLETFPIGNFDNDRIKEAEKKLLALSERKILNLGGQTNTDLKLLYGAANLPLLSEYDANFTELCRTLVFYAEALSALSLDAEARIVLEYGISCGSDVSRNYLLLAELYLKQGDRQAVERLILHAEKLTSPMKASILRRLHDLSGSVSAET